MIDRVVRYNGVTHHFPDDATDDDISQALAAMEDEERYRITTNTGLAGTAKPENPILKALHDPRSPHYQGSPFHESTSAENLGGWVEEGPGNVLGGLDDATNPNKKGTVTAHRILSGAGMTMLPIAPFALATAPVATIVGAGTGYATGKAGRGIAKLSGGDEDTQNLAEDIGNFAGGWAGAKGVRAIPGVVRATGRGFTKIGELPDVPTSPLMPRTMNFGAKLLNAGKSAAKSVGPKMSKVGLPPPPAPGPYREPELPSVRPDEQSHYNDVTDQGERNRLLDDLSANAPPEPRPTRPVVHRDDATHHDDVTVPEGVGPDMTTTKLTGPIRRPPKLPSRMYHGTSASNVPSILDEGLQSYEPGEGDVWEESREGTPSGESTGPYVTGDKSIARDIAKEESIMNAAANDDLSYEQLTSGNFNTPRHAVLDLDINRGRMGRGVIDPSVPASVNLLNSLPPNAVQGVSYYPPHELPESPLTRRIPTADETPTPESNLLLKAIKSAPGWPENGLPDKPWDAIHAESELPDALATDPYNRPPDRQIQAPTYQGPERRGVPRSIDPGQGEVIHPDDLHDPYSPHFIGDDPYYFGDPNNTDPTKGFVSNIEPSKTIDAQQTRPGLAETTAASDPTGDMDALSQARQELPDGTLSDHLQRAAQIAAEKRNQR